MNSAIDSRPHHRQRGVALVEFALVAPVLILLMLGIFDYARAIQANNILVNMSREAGNLAARTTANPQYIMNAVADTADPLDMADRGSLVITRVSGRADGRADVVEQYRWNGGAVRQSRIWSGCGSWSSGTCTVPYPRPVINAPVRLSVGEMVYVVEAFYVYEALFGFAMPVDPNMYSMTIL